MDFLGTAIDNSTSIAIAKKFENVENVKLNIDSVITEDYIKLQKEKAEREK